jgi:hypothetical protein
MPNFKGVISWIRFRYFTQVWQQVFISGKKLGKDNEKPLDLKGGETSGLVCGRICSRCSNWGFS